jgi:hypothetical protein
MKHAEGWPDTMFLYAFNAFPDENEPYIYAHYAGEFLNIN